MLDLCLTLAEGSYQELAEKIAKYSGLAPLIEVRLDCLDHPRLPEIPDHSPTEFLATFRPRRQGGNYEGSEEERLKLLMAAARNGFGWVDLEYDVEDKLDIPPETSVVRSYHSFEAFPDDLDSVLENLKSRGGDVFKVAVSISKTGQLRQLLLWMETLPAQIRRVVIGMNAFGQASRFLGKFLGNSWTYVSAAETGPAAPGQFTLLQAKDVYHIDQWLAAPSLYGEVGNPMGHSKSALLHNRLFEHYGQSGLFLPLQLDDLDPWFSYMESSSLSFKGLAVASPFETKVNSYLTRTSSTLESIDTLKREGSDWVGVNTACEGFLRPLMNRTTTLAGRRAVVLGDGSLARTAAAALRSRDAHVVLVGHGGNELADFSRKHQCETRPYSEFPVRAELLVIATSVGDGLDEEISSLPDTQLDFDLLYDLVSSPESARLLRLAARRGLETVTGVEMLVERIAGQFLEWTGIDPDRRLMREVINA